ncbi:MAG: DNA repair protein RecN [Anaerofustis sp.]
MLLTLNIKNYAIIDQLSIDFSEGLNVLTGETGAGKSIIVGALSLALGYRANTDAIRTGADRITVQALFSYDVDDAAVQQIFDEFGITSEDHTVLLTREIYANGRNVCRVNDVLINVLTLKSISAYLVDIHGQHEHQKLLNQETHIDFLDAYAGESIQTMKHETSVRYEEMKRAERELHMLIEKEKDARAKEDEVREHLKEINSLNLVVGEDEKLEERKKILSNSEKLFELTTSVYSLLYGSERNICDRLTEANNKLEAISEIDGSLKTDSQALNDALISVQEIVYSLRDYKDSIEFNPSELDNLETRLNKIDHLKRKYGQTIEEILEQADEYHSFLSLIENGEEQLAAARKRYDNNVASYLDSAIELSKGRKNAADRLTKRLMNNLNELAMPNAQFLISFEDTRKYNRLSPNGIDGVQFLISTNIGQEKKPLSKIASGGEVSRIMLAIKSIMADADHTDTLIFDEIDTGISGRTAQIVAEKMSELSRSHQILCITHLSQIASMADTHFLIEKSVIGNETYTSFKKLDYEGRTFELARMLGGVHVTETTLTHASEMLQLALEYKKTEPIRFSPAERNS